jgi:hypothetical protein
MPINLGYSIAETAVAQRFSIALRPVCIIKTPGTPVQTEPLFLGPRQGSSALMHFSEALPSAAAGECCISPRWTLRDVHR